MTEMREVLSQQVLQTSSWFDRTYLELAVGNRLEVDLGQCVSQRIVGNGWKWRSKLEPGNRMRCDNKHLCDSWQGMAGVNKNRRTQEHAGRKSPRSLQNFDVILYPGKSSSSSRVRFLRPETNGE